MPNRSKDWFEQALRDLAQAFERRPVNWKLESLPVQAEIIVYTVDEWQKLKNRGERFIKTIEKEVVWIYTKT